MQHDFPELKTRKLGTFHTCMAPQPRCNMPQCGIEKVDRKGVISGLISPAKLARCVSQSAHSATGALLNASLITAQSISVGVVLRRSPGVTKWAGVVWRAVSLLAGAEPANWKLLRKEGDVAEYHAATVTLTLYRSETEAYLHGLTAEVPCFYVVCRETDNTDAPLDVILVTASPYEAQDYCDNGEDIVEKIAMPPQLHGWVSAFVDEHHEEEEFVKRRRDKHREHRQDGIGDPRISQATDVYRAPRRTRTETAQ